MSYLLLYSFLGAHHTTQPTSSCNQALLYILGSTLEMCNDDSTLSAADNRRLKKLPTDIQSMCKAFYINAWIVTHAACPCCSFCTGWQLIQMAEDHILNFAQIHITGNFVIHHFQIPMLRWLSKLKFQLILFHIAKWLTLL